MDRFQKRLKSLREAKHPVKSRRIVSELCGLHHDAIRRYERGEETPTVEALISIAEYYEVSVDYLLGRTDDA